MISAGGISLGGVSAARSSGTAVGRRTRRAGRGEQERSRGGSRSTKWGLRGVAGSSYGSSYKSKPAASSVRERMEPPPGVGGQKAGESPHGQVRQPVRPAATLSRVSYYIT